MNYAQKELRKVIVRLQKARAAKQALKQQARAIRRGEPVEITLSTPNVAPVVLNSADLGAETSLALVGLLLNNTQADINRLKQLEIFGCEVVWRLAQWEKQPAATAAQQQQQSSPSAPQG
jgi:hypothetical protein